MAEKAQDVLEGLGVEVQTGYEGLPVLQTASEATLFQARKKAEAEVPTFGQSFSTLSSEEWIIPSLYENLDRMRSYDGQPVELTPDVVKTLTEGVSNKTAVTEILQEVRDCRYAERDGCTRNSSTDTTTP